MMPGRYGTAPSTGIEEAGDCKQATQSPNCPRALLLPRADRKSLSIKNRAKAILPPPPRAWLLRLVASQFEHGDKFSHARVVHQHACRTARGEKCTCDPEAFAVLKCGKEIAV
jgi:hypothetical protein